MVKYGSDENEFAAGGVLDGVLGYQVRMTHSLIRRSFHQTFADLGITNVEFALLLIIKARPGCSQHKASEAVGTPPTVSVHAIKNLVDGGLVCRQRDQADRRNYNLSLTPEGLAVVEEGLRRTQAAQEKMLAGLGRDEVSALFKALHLIQGNIAALL
jgi:DNA-binding MarR family transcriptional regulator